MVKRKAAVYAAAASLSALLMASCGGGADTSACGGASACVTTVAGTGQQGNVDGAAAQAQFSMPHSVVIDAQSNIHVADFGNNSLTRIISQGRVSTPPEDSISFPHPADVATDAGGNSYVADTYENRILKVTPAGETTVFAGTGQSGASDGDAATASFSMPTGLAFDAQGALYVADMGNRKIRKIEFSYRLAP
jgi:DNA-binding beta-propeller fold protein YncE